MFISMDFDGKRKCLATFIMVFYFGKNDPKLPYLKGKKKV